MEIVESDFPRMCRICLRTSEALVGMATTVRMENRDEPVSVMQMLQALSEHPGQRSVALPQHTCQECFQNCVAAFHFKHQIERSLVRLLQVVNKDVVTLEHVDLPRGLKTETVTPSEDEAVSHKDVEPARKAAGENPLGSDCESDDFPKVKEENDDKELLRSPLDKATEQEPSGNCKYPCPECPAQFKRKAHLSRHMLIHSGERQHACPQCDRSFNRSDHLQKHMKNVHTAEDFSEPPLKVEIMATDNEADGVEAVESGGCSENVITSESEGELFVSATESDKLPVDKKRNSRFPEVDSLSFDVQLTCPQCFTQFKRKSHLSRHMLIHSGLRSYRCPSCIKCFTRHDHLQKHIQSVHTEKEFQCQLCKATFARQPLLDEHMDKKHSQPDKAPKMHQCSTCSKSFTAKAYLTRHEISHLGFTCPRCNESFPSAETLQSHKQAANCFKRGHLCFICGESFTRGEYLRIHIRRHTGEKPYQCQYCDKKFPRSTDLKMHERYHTNTKPNTCTFCGKSFHRAYNLKIHIRTHTGERPYKCAECPKSFAQSNDLKTHMRRHTGERYQCTECDASFLQQFALRNHCSSAHGIEKEAKTSRLLNLSLAEPATVAQQTPPAIKPPNPI